MDLCDEYSTPREKALEEALSYYANQVRCEDENCEVEAWIDDRDDAITCTYPRGSKIEVMFCEVCGIEMGWFCQDHHVRNECDDCYEDMMCKVCTDTGDNRESDGVCEVCDKKICEIHNHGCHKCKLVVCEECDPKWGCKETHMTQDKC